MGNSKVELINVSNFEFLNKKDNYFNDKFFVKWRILYGER